jgi:hypothetical protein
MVVGEAQERRLRLAVERLHGDRPGGTATGAQTATDARGLVLQHEGARKIGLSVERGPPQRDQVDALLGADVDAAAALDALAPADRDRVEVGVHPAMQAAAPLRPGLRVGEDHLHLGAVSPPLEGDRRQRGARDLFVVTSRKGVVVPVGVEHSQPVARFLVAAAGEEAVDRARRAAAVGDRIDHNSRAEGDVAAREHTGAAGRERRRVHRDKVLWRRRKAVIDAEER